MTSEFYKVSHNRLVQQVLTKAKYDMQWVKDQSETVALKFDIVIPIRL
jgi:hypothetical protein